MCDYVSRILSFIITGLALTLQISIRAWVCRLFYSNHLVRLYSVLDSPEEKLGSGLVSITEQRLGSS